MRQRRPKNLNEKIEKFNKYLVSDPENFKNNWLSAFNSVQISGTSDGDPTANRILKTTKLFLEIGSGKGKFITELAAENPQNLYIGFEGQDTVILRALEKISEKDLNNIVMCKYYINDFGDIFGCGELNGIYLNFSDPWPKARHEKRRLTSPGYLDVYAKSLVDSGFIKMKTDNKDLFDYSMEQFKLHSKLSILEYTEDLHHSVYNDENIMTEYEKKFSNFNKKINYVCVNK